MMRSALPWRLAAGSLLAAAPQLWAAPAPGDLTVLNGLADIAEPPEPSAWPPNFWVLGLTLAGLGFTALIISRLWRRHQRRRPYRAALPEPQRRGRRRDADRPPSPRGPAALSKGSGGIAQRNGLRPVP